MIIIIIIITPASFCILQTCYAVDSCSCHLTKKLHEQEVKPKLLYVY